MKVIDRLQHPFPVMSLLALALLIAPGFRTWAQELKPEDLRVIPASEKAENQREMLASYLNGRVDEAAAKARARREAIQSPADFTAWQEANRAAFLDLIGGLPNERGPLNPRQVGQLTREGYVVRKIIFESLPEFYVTANLYVPTSGKGPFPGVLCPIGHSLNGKAYANYQKLFVGLARRGYVVLVWDPVGQGERVEYWDFLTNRRRFEFNQHGMEGLQTYLLGQNVARYFIWDGMRALDYLASLPEVDAERIGVTGNSGGGTLTTYIAMLDPRIKVASIVTFITSLPKKIEKRIDDFETDPEQDIAGLLAKGIDHPEYVGMIAPRPVMIGAALRDFFPIEGTRATFKESQELYRKLGVPERIKMVAFDHQHMYSQPLREATTAWFDHWLKGTEGEVHEPLIQPEPDKELECTPTGQVTTSLGGKRTYDFNRQEAERLLAALETRRRDASSRNGLAARLRERLDIPSGPVTVSAKSAGTATVGDLRVEKLLLETEAGIVVPVRLISPQSGAKPLPAVVYLRDRRGDRDTESLLAALARQGRVVAVADVRGFGETMSPRNVSDPRVDYFDPRDGMDSDFTYAAFFLGKSLAGMRVRDALGVAEYLRSRPEVDPKRVGITGRGWAGTIALFAAASDSQLAWAAVEGVPASFGEIATSELYSQPVSLTAPGVLKDFDLPDLLAAMAPRHVLVLNPTDARVRKLSRGDADGVYAEVRKAYNDAGAAPAFDSRVAVLDPDVDAALEKWIAAQ
ncbi:MAG: acetylxylan esterase [Terriglobia bacterium]